MAYSQEIEKTIDILIRSWPELEKKRMFGGICYLLHGNICFGIYREYLIVRVRKNLGSGFQVGKLKI